MEKIYITHMKNKELKISSLSILYMKKNMKNTILFLLYTCDIRQERERKHKCTFWTHIKTTKYYVCTLCAMWRTIYGFKGIKCNEIEDGEQPREFKLFHLFFLNCKKLWKFLKTIFIFFWILKPCPLMNYFAKKEK